MNEHTGRLRSNNVVYLAIALMSMGLALAAVGLARAETRRVGEVGRAALLDGVGEYALTADVGGSYVFTVPRGVEVTVLETNGRAADLATAAPADARAVGADAPADAQFLTTRLEADRDYAVTLAALDAPATVTLTQVRTVNDRSNGINITGALLIGAGAALFVVAMVKRRSAKQTWPVQWDGPGLPPPSAEQRLD
jgi:hypothetical protein